MTDLQKSNGTHKLFYLWPLAVVAGSALLGYGTLQNRVANAEEKVAEITKDQKAQVQAANVDSRLLVQVATEQKALKDQVESVNKKLDKLLERD